MRSLVVALALFLGACASLPEYERPSAVRVPVTIDLQAGHTLAVHVIQECDGSLPRIFRQVRHGQVLALESCPGLIKVESGRFVWQEFRPLQSDWRYELRITYPLKFSSIIHVR